LGRYGCGRGFRGVVAVIGATVGVDAGVALPHAASIVPVATTSITRAAPALSSTYSPASLLDPSGAPAAHYASPLSALVGAVS